MPKLLVRGLLRGVLAGLVLSHALRATGAENSPWFARVWQSEDGLPNNTVTGLAQTPDGYLWLGTPSGLVRFDGVRFENFSPTNFVAPPNRGTLVMLRGHGGALWLALDRGGIVRLDSTGTQAFTEGLPSRIPNALAEDSEGALWIAYRGGGVCRLRQGQVKVCAEEDGLPSGSDICALARDRQGRVWFAKAGQFGAIVGGRFQTLRRFDPEPARLSPARSGGLWLCSGFRLSRIAEDGSFHDLGEFEPEHAATAATALLEDRQGAVWIGTSFSGLFRYADGKFEPIGTSHQEILSLAEDREGNIWTGTGGGGLNRVRRRAVELQSSDDGLPYPAVQSVCEDVHGTIWAAAQNGTIARRAGGHWTALAAGEHWPADATCVAADPNGAVWIGTRRGLFCWRDGAFVDWGQPGKLAGQTLHTLLVSRAGDLWIGEESPQAIQCLRQGRLHTYAIPQDSRVVRAMAEDAAGNIWAGTSKGVLFRICGGDLKEVHLRPSGDLASIRCLHATPDGALWIGYAGWGVGVLKNGKYSEISTEQGLYDGYISHIIADTHGWLWFGADRGIFRVRQEELEAVAEARAARVHSIHYGRGEGLPSLQGNFGDSPDALRSRDGRLWIPMRTALAVIDPDKLGTDPGPAPVLLTRVAVDDRTVASYDTVLPPLAGGALDLRRSPSRLRIPAVHRRVDFEFSALEFTDPQNVQFRYRLQDFDEDWREAGNRRLAGYARLPAGDYQFEVMACNHAGIWSPVGANLALTVLPLFWQTRWFRMAILALFTLSLIGAVRYVSFRRLHQQLRSLEQQAALHKERARIAKDIHDDLGASLTQIGLLGELAHQDRDEPDRAAERIQKISTTARQAVRSLDEIVWAVNPRNDTVTHLIEYAGQFTLDYLRLAGLRCRLDLPEHPPARELSTDRRHNLFLALKEALHNIVKHAAATEVWLRAQASDEALEITVEDNGRGFEDAPDDAFADGLRNMRQRLADIGGECRIESRPGSGTRVTLRLPWARP